VQQGVDEVSLATAGHAGQAASAYASAAGLACNVFVPNQAGTIQKRWAEAHGADVRVVDGKLPEAGAVFADHLEADDGYSVATFHTPFRHEGKKTMGFELFEQFDWTPPDHVVYPTGGGVGLVGIWKAYRELREVGWLDGDPPALHVAQTTGVAPVVEAIQEGRREHAPWEDPETIARGVEIPDPGASPWMLEAVFESGGEGVAVSDEEAYEAVLDAARQGGVEMCVTAAVALAGAKKLAAEGTFGPDDDVVVINTGGGCKTAGKIGEYVEARDGE
jgi:threonine synthase